MVRSTKTLSSWFGTLLLASTMSVVLPTVAASPAGAAYTCNHTVTNSQPQAIPDNGTITSSQDLSALADNDRILDVDVIVSLTHTFVGDLEISLTSRGRTVSLIQRRGGSGDNLSATRFNDGAATPISSGAAPFSGQFQPEQSLNAFDDLEPAAPWTLTVRDAVGGDVGTLQSWTLVFRTRWCDDLDRDNVRNSLDDCASVKGILPHGCPQRARTVSISYSKAAQEFRGLLKCQAAVACADGQPVQVFRVRAGADALLGRVFTDAAGAYALPRANANAKGTFYAVAPKVYEERVAECKRAKSRTLTRG